MCNPNELIKRYKETQDVKLVCKEFGVSRATVYRWIKRARNAAFGHRGYLRHTGLKRKSKKPDNPRRCTLSSLERIVIMEVREQYGWCAQKITEFLKQEGKLAQDRGFATVYGFLRRKGVVQE